MIQRAGTTAAVSVLALGAGVLALYGVDLGRAPIYLHEAEVLFALHAHAIATTAHDAYGRFMPLYFQMSPIGENVWFQPALVYVTALFFEVLPVTEWTIRLPSVFIGLIDVLLTYAVARRIFAHRSRALVAAVLLALTPAHFIHSRIAMDYLYPVPFVLAWLLCLLIDLDGRRPLMLFAATSFLGLGMYTYIASLIMMPVYLSLTCLRLLATAARPRLYLVAAAGFMWPLILLLLWVPFHPSTVHETLGRYRVGEMVAAGRAAAGMPVLDILGELRRSAHFSGVTGRISLYWYFFDPSYLFLTGGYANVVNSTRHVGVFLLPFLVIVPLGIVEVAAGRRTPIGGLLLAGFLSAPLAACLVVPEPYAIDRELELLPFGVLLATFGVDRLLAARQRLWRVCAVALLALVPAHFAFFLFDYFRDYPLRSAMWFEGNRRGALESIISGESREHPVPVYLNTDRIPYIDAYWRLYLLKHRREDLVARTVYFDWNTLDVQAVPAGSFLLTRTDEVRAKALVQAGALCPFAVIPEPAEPSNFSILRRCGAAQ